MAKKRGNQFPLLIYSHHWKRWSCMGPLLVIASVALFLVAPRLDIPEMLRWLALFPALAGIMLFLYGLLTRHVPSVRLTRKYLRIQGPLYPLAISYNRVTGTRPVQTSSVFDPKHDRAARSAWPPKYWGMTALIVELKQFPVSESWLHLWLDRHLFLPNGTGLVLLVNDWMELSQQLDSIMAEHRLRRRGGTR